MDERQSSVENLETLIEKLRERIEGCEAEAAGLREILVQYQRIGAERQTGAAPRSPVRFALRTV